jgi:transcriptional regulator with XRE-family HTH domain
MLLPYVWLQCFAFVVGLVRFDVASAFTAGPSWFLRSPALSSGVLHESTTQSRRQLVVVQDQQRWNREIDEKSRRKAQGDGMGETVAGAVLGSLVLGPFGACCQVTMFFLLKFSITHSNIVHFLFVLLLGALFGASIGANIGARKAESDARKAEMERIGLSQDMLDMAQDIGLALQDSMEGIQAVQNSLETQQKMAKILDSDSAKLYEQAKAALDRPDEELARTILLKRANVQEKLKKGLISCAEEKKRLQKMEENIAELERRALEVDALLRRSVSAKCLQDSSQLGLSLRMEDPLLQKFKEIGIN